MAALPTADLTQTLAVKPVPLPQIPLGMYGPDVFGAGLGAGIMKASEDVSQVVQLQRHMDAGAAAMDAEGQFSQDSADMLMGYREKIQSMTGEELKDYTKKFQRQVDEQQKLRGAKLTDPLAAQEYAKRAGAHADRLYQVAGEVSFQRQVSYRKEIMTAQEKIAVDSSGLVNRGPDGLPVGGAAVPKDLQNAANALYSFAEGVHSDPSMVTLQGGVVYLNAAGKEKIQATTEAGLNNLLMAYIVKPEAGLAALKTIYPGTNQTVAEVLGAGASLWQKRFTEGHQSKVAMALGFQAQEKFGTNTTAARKWLGEQVPLRIADPTEQTVVIAEGMNQFNHFATQKISFKNTLEAERLKSYSDSVIGYGGFEEMQVAANGGDVKAAGMLANMSSIERKKVKEYSDTWKSGDPTSSFNRALAGFQLQRDLNPLHAFDAWTPQDTEDAALKVGPKLAPALRKMIHESQTKKDLDNVAFADARARMMQHGMKKFGLQKDPSDPLKIDLNNATDEQQIAFAMWQLGADEYLNSIKSDPKKRTGGPDPYGVSEYLNRSLQPVKVGETFGSGVGFPWATGTLAPLPLAAVMGRQLLVPYDRIPDMNRRIIEATIQSRGVPDKLKHFKGTDLVERMYQYELEKMHTAAGVKPLPSTPRP
jgi:hypothetical protein